MDKNKNKREKPLEVVLGSCLSTRLMIENDNNAI